MMFPGAQLQLSRSASGAQTGAATEVAGARVVGAAVVAIETHAHARQPLASVTQAGDCELL